MCRAKSSEAAWAQEGGLPCREVTQDCGMSCGPSLSPAQGPTPPCRLPTAWPTELTPRCSAWVLTQAPSILPIRASFLPRGGGMAGRPVLPHHARCGGWPDAPSHHVLVVLPGPGGCAVHAGCLECPAPGRSPSLLSWASGRPVGALCPFSLNGSCSWLCCRRPTASV